MSANSQVCASQRKVFEFGSGVEAHWRVCVVLHESSRQHSTVIIRCRISVCTSADLQRAAASAVISFVHVQPTSSRVRPGSTTSQGWRGESIRLMLRGRPALTQRSPASRRIADPPQTAALLSGTVHGDFARSNPSPPSGQLPAVPVPTSPAARVSACFIRLCSLRPSDALASCCSEAPVMEA